MKFLRVDQAFHEALDNKTFSGAQVLLGKGKECFFHKAYGTLCEEPRSLPVTESTLFDIASLTKPLCTATLMMVALEEGVLGLEDPVEKFLPQFSRPEKITLHHLLAHSSGLPDWLPLYQAVEGKGWPLAQIREFFIAEINRTPLIHPVGEKRVYSDLGFILLGFVLENAYRRNLSALFSQKMVTPLHLASTLFNPLTHSYQVNVKNIAATEVCPWRHRLLQGEVHDDNCFVLGGMAGHAGLFSNTHDLERFVQCILQTWEGKKVLCRPATLKKFIGPEVFPKLAWDTVSPSGSQAGKYFSPKTSIGHLAFTGCSLWIDLNDQKYIILLTNRVHPARNNEGIKEFRPRMHDLLVEVLLENCSKEL